jgi:flagellar protein FliJ
MSFRYALQKVVDLKGSEKSMAEWEYAASLGKLKDEEERFQQLIQERINVEQQLQEASESPTPLAKLTLLQRYIEILNERIIRQTEGVRCAASDVQMRQGTLADKMVNEKVWLNARERAYERFRSDKLVKEQNELDEMAIVRSSASRG